jgi:2Fe-2S ferredoxin
MPTLTYILNDDRRITLDAPAGATVMETAKANGVDGIVAVCSGALCCATCHVYVDTDWLPKLPDKSDAEEDMLDLVAAQLRQTSRLACQITLTDALSGLVVTIPKRQVSS